MSDGGTFSFKPMFLQSDLQWINQRAKKGEAVQISGLDHTAVPKGYLCSTLVYADVLAILFERFNVESNNPSIVFLFRRDGQNWRWVEGIEYDPQPDHDDLWAELNHLVVEKDEQWTAKQKTAK